MRILKVIGCAPSTSIALAMLAACAGPSQMSPTALTPISGLRLMQSGADAKATGFIFASDSQNNNVDIFSQKGKNKMVGQITGLSHPFGLATDIAGNVYIANQYIPTIPVYAPPYTGAPKLVLDATGYLPQEVAVSPSGVVAVPSFCNNSGCTTNYSVIFYPKNSSKACAKVVVPAHAQTVQAPAFDDADNLYIVGQITNTFNYYAGEITGGCKATGAKFLTIGSTDLTQFFDIHIDKADRIAILGVTSGNSAEIDTYSPPQNGSLGNPVSTTPLGSSFTLSFAFLPSGHDLYANTNLNGADKYDYPAGGSPEHSISFSFQDAHIAVSPPLIP
jgi:hypothetical protein